MPITLTIPMDNTFNLPEGQYRGRLVTISRRPNLSGDAAGEQVRFLFEMDIPSITRNIPMAGRNFALNLRGGSELRRFLESWLGRRFFEANCGKTFELESLVGREADLVLIHFQQVGYNKPMVFIQSAAPAGTLALTEQPTTKEGKD